MPIMDYLRASILDFSPGAEVETSPGLIRSTLKESVSELRQYLNEPKESTTSSERRLFIIETAINETTYQELEKLLASELGMSGDTFERHKWSQTTFRFNETINCPRLPTTARPRRSFSLEYFELWQVVGDTNQEFFDRHNPSTVECASTGRQIQCYKWMKSPERGWLLVASRKCSFWSKQNGDGWTGKWTY